MKSGIYHWNLCDFNRTLFNTKTPQSSLSSVSWDQSLKKCKKRVSMLGLLHDRCRPSCHYHTERKKKNHAWTLLQGPSAAVSGHVQPGDGSLPGQWEPHWARVWGSSLHQCPRARGWCSGAESGNPRRGVVASPGGLWRLTGAVRCRSAAAAPRGWLGSFAWVGDDVMGDWKMPLLWCQRRHRISSLRRHNPIWTSEISPVPLEAHTFFSHFISSCSFFED